MARAIITTTTLLHIYVKYKKKNNITTNEQKIDLNRQYFKQSLNYGRNVIFFSLLSLSIFVLSNIDLGRFLASFFHYFVCFFLYIFLFWLVYVCRYTITIVFSTNSSTYLRRAIPFVSYTEESPHLFYFSFLQCVQINIYFSVLHWLLLFLTVNTGMTENSIQ